MEKINRLLKINKNFLGLTVISCAIFIVLFFVLLLVATTHPILMLLSVLLICPCCWLFVQLLFKYKTKLQNDIKIRLTRLLRQEIHNELKAANINCFFDVKPTLFTDEYCSFDVHYSGVSITKFHYMHAKKVRDAINDELPSWYHINFWPIEDKNIQCDIVV